MVIFRTKQRTLFPCPTSAIDVSSIFQTQLDFGKRIANSFVERTVHTCLAVALTQSGKTGAMLSAVHHFISNPLLAIPLHHIFIITGHSSKEWLVQTKERFPVAMHHNIYHRNQLKQFILKVKTLSNVLIFIDETQIAYLKHQILQKSFIEAGLFGTNLYRNDIKFVLVSATPDGCVKRFVPPQPGHVICFMQPAPGYVSIFSLRSFQSKDLCGFHKDGILPHAFDNIRELKPFLNEPKYHIIRTHHSFMHDITIQNFKTVFGTSYRYKSYMDVDLDVILLIPPTKHTFIFIKEGLRCAKTIHKEHLGILYERFSKVVSDSAIIQGLAGRATGFHSQHLVVFTHLPSIERYALIWHNQFNPSLKWSNLKDSWRV